MAKSNRKKKSARKSPRNIAKESVARVVDQVKEPLSLLHTLKEEGMANAMALFGMASTVANEAGKNLRIEALKPQLRDVVCSLGFATRDDIAKLEARVEELEQKLSEKEFEAIRGHDEE